MARKDITPEHLIARAEITDRLNDYCRSMDRMDRPLGKSVWHEDGTAEYRSFFQGLGSEIIDRISDIHETMISTSHQITPASIRVDGGRAVSETYVTGTLLFEHDAALHLTEVYARYLDRWSRRDARWAIDHRLCIVDMTETRRVQTLLTPPQGRRDAGDPSYAHFADFDRA